MTWEIWLGLGLGFSAVVLGLFALRVSDHRSTHAVGIIVSGLALVPMLTLTAMRRAGASGTRQFNEPGGTSMDWWSAWVDLFPVYILGLLALCVASLVIGVFTIVSTARDRPPRHAITRTLHAISVPAQCGTAFWLVGVNFPSA